MRRSCALCLTQGGQQLSTGLSCDATIPVLWRTQCLCQCCSSKGFRRSSSALQGAVAGAHCSAAVLSSGFHSCAMPFVAIMAACGEVVEVDEVFVSTSAVLSSLPSSEAGEPPVQVPFDAFSVRCWAEGGFDAVFTFEFAISVLRVRPQGLAAREPCAPWQHHQADRACCWPGWCLCAVHCTVGYMATRHSEP